MARFPHAPWRKRGDSPGCRSDGWICASTAPVTLAALAACTSVARTFPAFFPSPLVGEGCIGGLLPPSLDRNADTLHRLWIRSIVGESVHSLRRYYPSPLPIPPPFT